MAFLSTMLRGRLSSSLLPAMTSLRHQAVHTSSTPGQAAMPQPVIDEPAEESVDWKGRLGEVRTDWT